MQRNYLLIPGPSCSATVLVTLYTYDAAGWIDTVTDPRGIVTKTLYDALGETLFTIAAWDGSYDPTGGTLPASTDADQTTAYAYDGNGNMITQTAVEPSGTPSQTTQYNYGVVIGGAPYVNYIFSNDLLASVEYPDPTTGEPSTSYIQYDAYDATGEITAMTDQNGTNHNYAYDLLGRMTVDSVAALGTGVDGAVRRVDWTYNDAGQLATTTTFADMDGDTVVNQVLDQYNGLGQLTAEYQSHSGAVDVDSTPVTQYAYSDPSTGSRMASMTYPNGTVLDYSYGADGSLNDAIGRLAALTQDGTTLESYQYLGLSTVVSEADADGIILTDLQQPTDVYANTDGGDQYTGLDRFGRTIDQNYVTIATGATVERYQYTYDADGNVTSKTNLLDSSLDETYTYDNLNRLTSDTRGGTAYQSWDLDSLGNMDSITTSGTSETNTFNSQNEMTEEGASTLAYDANGNNTTDDQGDTLIYDAWNRLVQVKDSSGDTITTYGYDGTGRRITEVPTGGTTSDLYYSDQWQVIEERQGGTASSDVAYTYIWSPTYIDALLTRDTYSGGILTQRLYAEHDTTYNVTALIGYNTETDTWQVQERYLYDAYGSVTILNPDFTVKSTQTTLDEWNYLFQGKRRDFTIGLDDSRNRIYSPSMQRWLQQDPSGYVDGSNLMQFVQDNSIINIDPYGLAIERNPCCQKALNVLLSDSNILLHAQAEAKLANDDYQKAEKDFGLSTVALSESITALGNANVQETVATFTAKVDYLTMIETRGEEFEPLKAIEERYREDLTLLGEAKDNVADAKIKVSEAEQNQDAAEADLLKYTKIKDLSDSIVNGDSIDFEEAYSNYLKCLYEHM